jgi:hypothetical protein
MTEAGARARAAPTVPPRVRRLAARLSYRGNPLFAPRLQDLAKVSDQVTVDALRFVTALAGASPPEGLVSEARDALGRVDRLREVTPTIFPRGYALTEEQALALYTLVRLTAPETVVESGVADGYSSAVILEALQAAGRGRLVSLDVDARSGALPRASPARERWEFRPSGPGRAARRSLRDALESVRPVGFFLHDSVHTYGGHLADLVAAWGSLAPGGVLLSDDVDNSYAFLDFVPGRGASAFLVTTKKVLGGIRKGLDRSRPGA